MKKKAYADYQIAHEDTILKPGSGFALVKALLKLNSRFDKRKVEVLIMSRNSADTSLRIFNSIAHYQLDISRAVLSGGAALSPYLSSFGVDLFLSANEEDVKAAIQAGFAAGRIYTNAIQDFDPMQEIEQIRIAFDGMLFCLAMRQSASFRKKAWQPLWKMSKKKLFNNCRLDHLRVF